VCGFCEEGTQRGQRHRPQGVPAQRPPRVRACIVKRVTLLSAAVMSVAAVVV
jgi:hypothetical protein